MPVGGWIYCNEYSPPQASLFAETSRTGSREQERERRRLAVKNGFDNDKYLKMQSEHIKERIAQFGGKLYLEFGGKLFDDFHASRVLPGFAPDSKVKMLLQLK